uniref:TMEM132 domain-containing protein n=1 Tax=Heterorhabditis bacteriophora TaxID=37862 RepID=A0A1I7XUW8_HETBA
MSFESETDGKSFVFDEYLILLMVIRSLWRTLIYRLMCRGSETSDFTSPENNDARVFPGQQGTSADASRIMQNDIDVAVSMNCKSYKITILKSLNTLGVSSVGVTWNMDGYKPLDCLIPIEKNTKNNTCIHEGDVITGIYFTSGAENATQHGVLHVSTTLLVTRSQWKYLATVVYNQLNLCSKVRFTTPIELQ